MEKEVWRDIPSHLGLYQASNLGRIRTYPKHVCYYNDHGEEIDIVIGGDILQSPISKDNREIVVLSNNGELHCKQVGRWVAQAFIPNPNNLPEVNHIDENPLNNRVENLEWCTREYNVNYGTRNSRASATRRKLYKKNIGMYAPNTNILLKVFHNYIEINEFFQKTVRPNVIATCKGLRKTCMGYSWRIIKDE